MLPFWRCVVCSQEPDGLADMAMMMHSAHHSLSHAISFHVSLVHCHVMCRSAFKALAYKKYQQVPLYLEWAPKDIWDAPAPAAASAAKPAAEPAAGDSKPAAAAGSAAGTAAGDAAAAAAASKPAAAAAAAGDEGDDEDGQQAPVACIYVKNLNFATGDAALRKHFDKAVSAAGGSIHSAKVGVVCGTAGSRTTTQGQSVCAYGMFPADSSAGPDQLGWARTALP
jgi:multiple RNA-binding domain-containing protein 1